MFLHIFSAIEAGVAVLILLIAVFIVFVIIIIILIVLGLTIHGWLTGPERTDVFADPARRIAEEKFRKLSQKVIKLRVADNFLDQWTRPPTRKQWEKLLEEAKDVDKEYLATHPGHSEGQDFRCLEDNILMAIYEKFEKNKMPKV